MNTRNTTLDALRGIAALMVFAAHAGGALDARLFGLMHDWFDLGQCGVVIFFLISGWIIPQSIARGAQVFWIRRLFRLYPLYWVSIGILGGTGASLLINATMLQNVVGVADINMGAWTLALELLFYVVVTLIRLPAAWMAPICLAGALVFPPLGYLALIYAGGALREQRMAIAVACVLLFALSDSTALGWARVAGLAVFWLAMRASSAPRLLVWAGERSYSIYLMHPIAMGLLSPILWLPGVLALAALTYRAIEQPAIAFARLLTAPPALPDAAGITGGRSPSTR